MEASAQDIQLDGEECCVAYAPQESTGIKSTDINIFTFNE